MPCDTVALDVVLSDIDMPRLGGVALLERIRSHDLDIPVILITGSPSLETAVAAVQHGALRYLTKPVDAHQLRSVTADAVRLHRLARAKRSALDLAGGVDRLVGDRAGLVASFGRALDTLWIAYQPIVSWSRREVFGYEALLRSREPSLPHPGAILDAAEQLKRLPELGRAIRSRAAESLAMMPDHAALFVNLHTHDLLDEDLFEADRPLARIASRVVLEITERASLHHIVDVQARIGQAARIGVPHRRRRSWSRLCRSDELRPSRAGGGQARHVARSRCARSTNEAHACPDDDRHVP